MNRIALEFGAVKMNRMIIMLSGYYFLKFQMSIYIQYLS